MKAACKVGQKPGLTNAHDAAHDAVPHYQGAGAKEEWRTGGAHEGGVRQVLRGVMPRVHDRPIEHRVVARALDPGVVERHLCRVARFGLQREQVHDQILGRVGQTPPAGVLHRDRGYFLTPLLQSNPNLHRDRS